MSATVIPALLSSEEVVRPLPMPPVAFALIAFAAFLLGLGILWSFRNTAAKVASKQARVQAAKDARTGAGPTQGHH